MHTFVPNKSFVYLSEILPTNSELPYILSMVYRSKQSTTRNRNRMNLALPISCCITYKMWYSIESRDKIFVQGYGHLSFAKDMGKT